MAGVTIVLSAMEGEAITAEVGMKPIVADKATDEMNAAKGIEEMMAAEARAIVVDIVKTEDIQKNTKATATGGGNVAAENRTMMEATITTK